MNDAISIIKSGRLLTTQDVLRDTCSCSLTELQEWGGDWMIIPLV